MCLYVVHNSCTFLLQNLKESNSNDSIDLCSHFRNVPNTPAIIMGKFRFRDLACVEHDTTKRQKSKSTFVIRDNREKNYQIIECPV